MNVTRTCVCVCVPVRVWCVYARVYTRACVRVCACVLFDEWIRVQYANGHWARAHTTRKRLRRVREPISNICCRFGGTKTFPFRFHSFVAYSFEFSSVLNTIIFSSFRSRRARVCVSANTVDAIYTDRYPVSIRYRCRHSWLYLECVIRTGEGFINRVIDKRVGRWDFRSFGSLSRTSRGSTRFLVYFSTLSKT